MFNIFVACNIYLFTSNNQMSEAINSDSICVSNKIIFAIIRALQMCFKLHFDLILELFSY